MAKDRLIEVPVNGLVRKSIRQAKSAIVRELQETDDKKKCGELNQRLRLLSESTAQPVGGVVGNVYHIPESVLPESLSNYAEMMQDPPAGFQEIPIEGLPANETATIHIPDEDAE